MPYKSNAQQRYFHYLESKGKLPKKVVDEYDEETDFDSIPERVPAYHGGMVGHLPRYDFDEEMGEASDYDSSGEPDKEEEEEGYYRGGVVKMAKGGMARMNSFAKALRKAG